MALKKQYRPKDMILDMLSYWINLDAFLKLVVTPFLAASDIGAVAALLTFFVGQVVLQPIIHLICFFGFDD